MYRYRSKAGMPNLFSGHWLSDDGAANPSANMGANMGAKLAG